MRLPPTLFSAAVSLACGAGALACGSGEREVRAHHAGGALATEVREVRLADGTWTEDGAFRAWYEDGTLEAQGSFLAGVEVGPWTRWYPDGTTRERGSYLFGRKEGVWVHRHCDGSIDPELSGVYEDGRRIDDFLIDGTLTTEFADGSPSDVTDYVDGVRHGKSGSWYPNGARRSEGTYEHGRRVGEWTFWKPRPAPDEPAGYGAGSER